MLKTYLKKISDTATRGDAREESYYSTLKDLLDLYCNSIGKKNIHITSQPKKTEAGNPDFRVWDGKQHITGYIEAKDPVVDNLDRIEETDQLKRYLHTFPNLILTNFLEFRLYRNGILTNKVISGRPFILHKLKTTPPAEKEHELLQLFEKFFSFSIPIDNSHSSCISRQNTSRISDGVSGTPFSSDGRLTLFSSRIASNPWKAR